ncbi:predicted protein [Uncinocarpus reesii 1704]|uniref:NF-kappa-B inhibitor-like protein 1 n=1 Tax=Uncinocarpus reesii (strain UAMH 1704) TaxID=336963 RepID=C4JXF3_UNCRE|nr:uncharacterized protein UREG_06326 [Uncinocarpus reesii 1704]EEP81461.1 predicted protein [Uncinocarpus reesii 1704]
MHSLDGEKLDGPGPNGGNQNAAHLHDDYSAARGSRIRLKSESSRKHKDSDERHSRHRTRRDRHRRHRSKRHKASRSEEETADPPLSPNTAFRESLFDAMADDEGAAYWEGVFSQPIHTYPRPEKADGRGKLERMSDEEYAAYVRARMWEKTHQAVFEERERRRRAREAEKESGKRSREQRRPETDREAFEKLVDESLRRGRERRDKKKKTNMWVDIWGRYMESWKELDSMAQEAALLKNAEPTIAGPSPHLRNLIVWPVESGKRRDITPQAVEYFLRNAPFNSTSSQGAGSANPPYPDLLTALKTERVRWHPDKIKHRYGVLGMEEQLTKSATEVFQIVDKLWVEERSRSERT